MTVLDEIAAERRRQVEQEGWSPEHDDERSVGELAFAAAAYALSSASGLRFHSGAIPQFWPLPSKWWKPTTPRRDLIKAAALIVAEIERLDRAAAKGNAP